MIPLVLVHGFMGGSAQWAGQGAHFGEARDLIALDLPGFGLNNHLAPCAGIGAMADWVIARLQAQGVDRYDLLGHSMGGMIAQEIARRDAPRIGKLVLYATGAQGVLPGRFETIAQSKARAVTDGPIATARRIAATWFLEGADAPAYPDCAAIAQRAGPAALAAGLDAMEGWSGADALGQITAQTLLIWGDQDRTYPWPQIEALWRGIPVASLAVLPGCAHAVHLEEADLFNRILARFLTGRGV